jgi:hypothetical protein
MEKRMKAHLAKLSLALLSTVFLFGCQDLGSGPVGLDGLGPEFHHRDGHSKGGDGGGGSGGVATFWATFESGVTQEGIITLGAPKGRKQSVQTLTGMPGGEPAVRATLDLTFLQKSVTGGETCFPLNSGNGTEPTSVFNGPLSVGLAKDLTNMRVAFYFPAFGTDGTEVSYLLALPGSTSDPWPPADGTPTTITGVGFNIHHNSGGSSVACTGEGPLIYSLRIERIPPQ